LNNLEIDSNVIDSLEIQESGCLRIKPLNPSIYKESELRTEFHDENIIK
jgi:hypothetical protein